jgi:hypothetical protein
LVPGVVPLSKSLQTIAHGFFNSHFQNGAKKKKGQLRPIKK